MARQNPTRMNLINTKREMRLAQKGHDLLKRKREALVIEFFKMLQISQTDRNHLDEVLNVAYKTTAMASTFVGDFELEQASLYVPDTSQVSIGVKNIMGVKIPEIQKEAKQSIEYAKLQTDIGVSDVGESFTNVKEIIIEIAKREQGLRRLITEIDKVKRRVNALEYILLPSLSREATYISFRLDEMDRDTFSALKHVKKKLASGKK